MSPSSAARAAAVLAVLAAVVVPAGTAIAGGGGCHGRVTQGRGDTVRMTEVCFSPHVLYVEPGTEVTFVNRDPVIHDVAAPRWASPGDLRTDRAFTATFAREGVYPFACSYHWGMTGAIVVGDGAGPGSGRAVTVDSALGDASPVSAERAGGLEVPPVDDPWLGWVLLIPVLLIGATGLINLLLRRPPPD